MTVYSGPERRRLWWLWDIAQIMGLLGAILFALLFMAICLVFGCALALGFISVLP